MQMSRVASTGGNAQRHAQSTSATAAARSNPSSLASHRLADTDLGVGADTLLQDAEAPQAGVHSNPAQGVHAVDPIEAFAPAFMLERMEHSAAAGAGLLAKPVGDYSAVQAAQAAVEPAALSVTLGLPGEGAQGDATAAQDSNIQGSAENEWTGFAVDDSLAAEGAEPINHLMTQHILVASSPVGNGSSGQASSEGQDSSIAAYTAAHLESDAQVSTQEDGLTVPGEDQHRQFSRHAAPNSFILGQPSTAAALAADSHHQDVVSASPADFKAAAATAVQISQDKQPAVSRRSAQQSGITSARKALQAMALKAAADAAYRGESSAVSSAPEQPQSALRQTTSSISRQSDALWTPQSTRTSQGDLTGRVLDVCKPSNAFVMALWSLCSFVSILACVRGARQQVYDMHRADLVLPTHE